MQRLGQDDKDEKRILSLTSTIVAVVVVVVENELVVIEDSEGSGTGSGLETGSNPEGDSDGGLWDSMPLSVEAMGGVLGGNSGREENCIIFSLCAFFRFPDLDLSLFRKALILSTTVTEQMRAQREGRRSIGLSGFEPNHTRAFAQHN